MYVDKAEENIKQHLHVIHLEDGKGITRINYELNINNDISVLYNCKDATKTKQKTPSLATQSINNINIDSSYITKPIFVNVTVATYMLIPASLFGSISHTLENKDQQPESVLTSIPANALYFKESSNPTFPILIIML